MSDMPEPVRIDKWLWAARFFKTRALAADAVTGGKVELNGQKPKPAKTVHPGDRVRLRLGPYEHLLTVVALAARRGPASEATKLYQEDAESRTRRARLAEQHRIAATAFAHGEGKPSRQEREAVRKLKGKD
jgi:ribosome-associated heat shock protein Hsp15